MKLYIRSATQKIPPASQQVNRVGKYLYKHLDGAFRYATDRNMYDVYVTLLYQLKPEYGGKVNDVQEMTINLNITTYQNKIRFNTIEMTPQERTLGFDLMNPEDMMNLKKAKEIILRVVRKRICNAYKNHIILF